jgi:hypothetical protein
MSLPVLPDTLVVLPDNSPTVLYTVTPPGDFPNPAFIPAGHHFISINLDQILVTIEWSAFGRNDQPAPITFYGYILADATRTHTPSVMSAPANSVSFTLDWFLSWMQYPFAGSPELWMQCAYADNTGPTVNELFRLALPLNQQYINPIDIPPPAPSKAVIYATPPTVSLPNIKRCINYCCDGIAAQSELSIKIVHL